MSDDEHRAATLEPETELEDILAAAQNGEISSADFLQHLARSRVCITINQSVAEEESPRDVEPLVLEAPDGTPMLAVFSQSDRAAVMTEQFPDFGFTIEVDFPWVVANCGEAMGIVLNPGWNIGASLPPQAVEYLRDGQG